MMRPLIRRYLLGIALGTLAMTAALYVLAYIAVGGQDGRDWHCQNDICDRR